MDAQLDALGCGRWIVLGFNWHETATALRRQAYALLALSMTVIVGLFEPFYRLDVARNSETGGNGLGLPICKAIADANGWKLRLLHSERGVMSEVVFG